MFHRLFYLSCCILFTNTWAQSANETTLSLDQAVVRVLENNPKLRVGDYQAQAMAARIRQTSQVPADRMGVTLENFAGTGQHAAVRAIEATLSLSRTLELGNKASLRSDVVEGELGLLNNQNEIDRLNLLADTAQRFVHVAADQERLRLIEESMLLIQQTQSVVEEQVRAGKSPEIERQRVLIDLANHDIELEHIRHELGNARVSLVTLWGARTPDFERVSADIYSLDELPEFTQLTDLLDHNPRITRHLRMEDISRARIKLANSRRIPDIELSAGVRYLGGSNDVAAMLWASIPIGSATRAKPFVEEAEVMAEVDPLNQEQQRLELYALLFEFYQEMKHAQEAAEVLKDRIIPAAEKMLVEFENGYQAGRYSLLELTQTRQQLQQAKFRLLENANSFHSNKIEIDRLTAAQLSKW